MFKKRITPFTCLLLSVAVCIITCVATVSMQNVRHKAELNEERLIISEHAGVINAVGDSDEEYIKLASLIQMMEQYYVNGIDKKTLWDNIYRTLGLAVGDRYGEYYTIEDYETLTNENDGDFVGVGVRVSYDVDMDGAYVSHIMKGSPAQGKLQVGDVILAVEGSRISLENYSESISQVRGEAGTDVIFTVLRGEEEFDITLTRTEVASENVVYENLGNGVAYINIITFSDETVSSQFLENISLAQKDGCDKFIFDVRNNSGGKLEEVVKILDAVLPEGDIIHIVDKNGTKTRKSNADCIKAESMAVICNGRTASAAELFTAALRDYDLAEIVGEKTFGKGTMQTHIPLDDGSVIKITTSYYNPPKGENYDGVGITPDYEIKLKEEWADRFYKMPKEEDTQLQKAIELVTSTK